ncbi:hypothetical protein K491DRAFT_678478 [Lophiostoma macrostomum CBS 122681]|uniref:Uncharacterized protein n=1 Tax=Lophiostoma macrostomum CBS 122681 TaxID=1314788 RepID=A0A6A6T7K5_9PLEO|nr:hypothetical protein K491DRAFT_678478 [Lophiostoma macrostomum CBS 122681]
MFPERQVSTIKKTVRFASQEPEIRVIPATMGTWAHDKPLQAPGEQASIWCSNQMSKAIEGQVQEYDPHEDLPSIEEIQDISWPGKLDSNAVRPQYSRGIPATPARQSFLTPIPSSMVGQGSRTTRAFMDSEKQLPPLPTEDARPAPIPRHSDFQQFLTAGNMRTWDEDDSDRKHSSFASAVSLASGLKKFGRKALKKADEKLSAARR